jgi:microcystin-dependent protein
LRNFSIYIQTAKDLRYVSFAGSQNQHTRNTTPASPLRRQKPTGLEKLMSVKSFSLAACTALTATFGLFAPTTAQAGTDTYIGEIMMFGGNFCPRGYAAADGQLISIASNSALFSIFGTFYGGDGRTTFGLPDLRGRVPVHVGSGPGLPPVREGQKGGAPNTTLTVANLPAHKHDVAVSTTVTATLNSVGSGATNVATGQYIAGGGSTTYGIRPPIAAMNAGSVAATAANTVTEKPVGSGAAFNNIPPYLGIRYCVALQGIFPSRN